ncbi:MAG TPA: tartrate-resistant acid phosphatase type 5 family protein [Verrucomicrobiae bacterium]|nr:tartrate-resistant acid phosphatase type 5 family protein [Verrucomicrobiae bacterium]
MKQTRRQFVRTLFAATQAAAVGSLLPRSVFAADARSNGLNFLVIGDWGRNGEPDQTAVATQMGVAAQAVNAKFIISVGDNFYEDGVFSTADLQWRYSFEEVYTAPSLQVPWWVVLGNHDYHGNCDAQIEYSKISKRWNMPARYFVRTERIDAGTAADFFYLDTTPMAKLEGGEMIFSGNVKSQDVDKQVAWFESALKASTAPWKIVIGHHPIYTGGQHGNTPYLVEHILPLLETYQVQAYFNGHDHDLQHLQAGAVNLFCSGGGSRPRANIVDTPRTKFGQGCSGFAAAALQPDQMDVRLVDGRGKTLYTFAVPRKA